MAQASFEPATARSRVLRSAAAPHWLGSYIPIYHQLEFIINDFVSRGGSAAVRLIGNLRFSETIHQKYVTSFFYFDRIHSGKDDVKFEFISEFRLRVNFVPNVHSVTFNTRTGSKINSKTLLHIIMGHGGSPPPK